jgi:outer membrane protein
MAVIDKYAQQNGFAIVLDVSSQNTPVLYASNTVDITKEVIDLYDKTVFTATPTSTAPGAARPAAPPAARPAPATAAPKPTAPPAAAPAKKQ